MFFLVSKVAAPVPPNNRQRPRPTVGVLGVFPVIVVHTRFSGSEVVSKRPKSGSLSEHNEYTHNSIYRILFNKWRPVLYLIYQRFVF